MNAVVVCVICLSFYLYSEMGVQFYLKSLATVSVTVLLALLTWHKAKEIVCKVENFQSNQSYNIMSSERTTISSDKVENKDIVNVATDSDISEHGSQITTEDIQSPTTTSATVTYEQNVGNTESTESDPVNFVERSGTSDIATTSTNASASTATTSTRAPHSSSNEKRHVVFLKVHKTGSSTVQNIFLRFGDSRNLTFILAHDNINIAETKFPNMISYRNTLEDHNIVPPPYGHHYEILCCHVIYNRIQFEKYLPNDTAYIGLVRDPVTRLESSFRYFNMYPNISMSDFAANPLSYDKGLHSMANNRMSFEFGFPLDLFPNAILQPQNVQQRIRQYINKLMNEFDLIMINEKMDESLVLMKRILNWHTKDIVYMKQLVAHHYTRRFSDMDVKSLNSYLYIDFALYQSVLAEFNAKVDNLGADFKKEVIHFKQGNSKINDFCSYSTPDKVSLTLGHSAWGSSYTITHADCRLYKEYEIKFMQDIRMKQYGKLGI